MTFDQDLTLEDSNVASAATGKAPAPAIRRSI